MTLTTMTLTTDTNDTIVVRDSDGGIWWPSEEALAQIRASDTPEETAIDICEREPMRGYWKQ